MLFPPCVLRFGIGSFLGLIAIFGPSTHVWAATPRTRISAFKAEKPDYKGVLASARAHAQSNEWPQAVSDFTTALRANPKDAQVLEELGMALLMVQKFDPAQRTALQALKFSTTAERKAGAFYTLGRIAEARNRPAEALASYNKSLSFEQRDETVWRIYQLDEFSPAVPCRSARSMEQICTCLNSLLGGSCFVEDDIQPTVKRLRASWTAKAQTVGTASAFLALQAAGGWFLVAHLGRLRDTPPHHLILTNMKAEVRTAGSRQVYKVEYTSMDNEAACGTLSQQDVKGLDREYQLDCLREARYLLACLSSPDGQTVSCPVEALLSCKRGKSAHITDEFAGLGSGVRAQVRAWEARSQSAAQGQLQLTAAGVLTGTALIGNAAGTACPKPKGLQHRLY